MDFSDPHGFIAKRRKIAKPSYTDEPMFVGASALTAKRKPVFKKGM